MQDALAKLAAAHAALDETTKLASSRGSQVEQLSSQLDSLQATLGSMSQGQQDVGAVSAQISEREAQIKVGFGGQRCKCSPQAWWECV